MVSRQVRDLETESSILSTPTLRECQTGLHLLFPKRKLSCRSLVSHFLTQLGRCPVWGSLPCRTGSTPVTATGLAKTAWAVGLEAATVLCSVFEIGYLGYDAEAR